MTHATAFEYFPWLRPGHVYQWQGQIRRVLEPLLAAGGRKNRWYATDILLGGGADNPLLVPLETRDFYLAVPPDSYVWGVSAYGESAVQNAANSTSAALQLNAGLEIEIIDVCTREAWWRTSESQCELGEIAYSEPNSVAVTNVFAETDRLQFGLGMWLLSKPHLTAKPGTQLVRLTANGTSLSTGGAGSDSQVILWASVPEDAD